MPPDANASESGRVKRQGLPMSGERYVRWFDELTNDDVALIGGKNAWLDEMHSALSSRGGRRMTAAN